jgi:hypothetical protein
MRGGLRVELCCRVTILDILRISTGVSQKDVVVYGSK